MCEPKSKNGLDFLAVLDSWMDPTSTRDLLQNGMLKRISTAKALWIQCTGCL
jgi:hypothetical protein